MSCGDSDYLTPVNVGQLSSDMTYIPWERLEAEYREIYERMETNEEGEITMRTVVEHIKGVEAGSGNNAWVR